MKYQEHLVKYKKVMKEVIKSYFEVGGVKLSEVFITQGFWGKNLNLFWLDIAQVPDQDDEDRDIYYHEPRAEKITFVILPGKGQLEFDFFEWVQDNKVPVSDFLRRAEVGAFSELKDISCVGLDEVPKKHETFYNPVPARITTRYENVTKQKVYVEIEIWFDYGS